MKVLETNACVNAVAFYHNFLAIGLANGLVIVYDITNWTKVKELNYSSRANAVAFHRNLLATGLDDNSVIVYALQPLGKCIGLSQ